MKRETTLTTAIRLSLVLAVAVAFTAIIWSPVQAQKAESAARVMKMDGKMMERCQEMKEQKRIMMEDMKAQDADLIEQVAKMNAAPKDKKMDVIATVVTQMVEQRTAMDARMAKMDEEMMSHMMQHMQMGSESTSQCPMMKDMSEKSVGTHEGHHDEKK